MIDSTITNFARAYVNGQEYAFNSFAQSLIELCSISLEDARKVTNLYIRERIVKYTHTMQRYDVKNGAFLDADVIARAIVMANQPAPERKSRKGSK